METLAWNSAMQTYAVCSGLLVLKMLGSAIYTAVQRARVSGYINQEDTRFGGEGAMAAAIEKPEVAHALRIQRNDLENIPAFWMIGLLYVLSGASAFGTAIYCWTFALARIAHTLVYIRHLQPVRAILWLIGVACIVGMGVQVIAAGLM